MWVRGGRESWIGSTGEGGVSAAGYVCLSRNTREHTLPFVAFLITPNSQMSDSEPTRYALRATHVQ